MGLRGKSPQGVGSSGGKRVTAEEVYEVRAVLQLRLGGKGPLKCQLRGQRASPPYLSMKSVGGDVEGQ